MTRRGLFRALFAAPVAAVAATLALKATPVERAGRQLGQMAATLSKEQVCALFNVPVQICFGPGTIAPLRRLPINCRCTIDSATPINLKEAIRCKVASAIERRITDDVLYGELQLRNTGWYLARHFPTIGRVVMRRSNTGRGWRLHETNRIDGSSTDVRTTIRLFIAQEQK